jgi:hypothetical protein
MPADGEPIVDPVAAVGHTRFHAFDANGMWTERPSATYEDTGGSAATFDTIELRKNSAS